MNNSLAILKSLERSEESILVVPHIIIQHLDALDVKPPLAGVLEAFILSKGLDVIDVGKLHHWRFANVRFQEGDVECHHGADGLKGELERDDFVVIKYFN